MSLSIGMEWVQYDTLFLSPLLLNYQLHLKKEWIMGLKSTFLEEYSNICFYK